MNSTHLLTRQLKSAAQSALLLVAMAALLGTIAWLLGGVALAFLTIVATALLFGSAGRGVPGWLLRWRGSRPLSRHEAPRLFELVAELARRAGLERVPALFLTRDPVPGAFTTGRRDDAAVALSVGLLQRLDERQIAGVLAHELSHLRNGDTSVMSFAAVISRVTGVLSTLGQLLLFVNLPLLLLGYVTVSWWAILLLLFAPMLSALIQLALSRTRELAADLGAVELLGGPEPLMSALAELERSQQRRLARMFWPLPVPTGPAFLRTHPPTEERLRRLAEGRRSAIPRPVSRDPRLHGFFACAAPPRP